MYTHRVHTKQQQLSRQNKSQTAAAAMLHSKRQSTQFESIQTQQLKPTGTITAKSVMKRQRKTHHTIMNNDKGCAAMEQQEVDVQSPSPVNVLKRERSHLHNN